jgi:hypothetical protein
MKEGWNWDMLCALRHGSRVALFLHWTWFGGGNDGIFLCFPAFRERVVTAPWGAYFWVEGAVASGKRGFMVYGQKEKQM